MCGGSFTVSSSVIGVYSLVNEFSGRSEGSGVAFGQNGLSVDVGNSEMGPLCISCFPAAVS